MTQSDEWGAASHHGQSTARRPRRARPGLIAAIVVLALLAGYAIFAATRSATFGPQQRSRAITVAGAALQPQWPDYGQAALALGDGPIVARHGTQKPAAMASTAKLITCLVVLGKRPLKSGQDGPTLTMTAADVKRYQRYVAVEGSVTAVRVGQRLTERDLLEAILLPSANNLADTMAIWAFGSLPAYRTAATAWLKAHDLTHTTVGSDASGYSSDSASTADDLVRLGQLTMANPVLRHIVGQDTAQIPDVGTVYNVDTILGDGIVGVKTGNSDQNGGVFVGAAQKKIGGRQVTVVSAISGAPSLDAALGDSRTLLRSALNQARTKTIVAKGQTVGEYETADGTVDAVAAEDVQATLFGPEKVTATVTLDEVSPGAAGRVVGHIEVDGATTPVVTKDAVDEPSFFHQLLHP